MARGRGRPGAAPQGQLGVVGRVLDDQRVDRVSPETSVRGLSTRSAMRFGGGGEEGKLPHSPQKAGLHGLQRISSPILGDCTHSYMHVEMPLAPMTPSGPDLSLYIVPVPIYGGRHEQTPINSSILRFLVPLFLASSPPPAAPRRPRRPSPAPPARSFTRAGLHRKQLRWRRALRPWSPGKPESAPADHRPG